MKALKLTAAVVLVNAALFFLWLTYVSELEKAHQAGREQGAREALHFIADLCKRGGDIVTINGATYACQKRARL